MKESRSKVTRSSGNIFADLKLPNPEELELRAKAAFVIAELINRQGLSQPAAAIKLGVAQTDVSRIVNGRLDGYSLERLLTLVQRLGNDIMINVKPARNSQTGKILMTA